MRLVGRFAADADRREEEAVALGDRQVQAHVAGDEVLELVADRVDQRTVGAEVLGARQRRLARGDALAALDPGRCAGRTAGRRRAIEIGARLGQVAARLPARSSDAHRGGSSS